MAIKVTKMPLAQRIAQANPIRTTVHRSTITFIPNTTNDRATKGSDAAHGPGTPKKKKKKMRKKGCPTHNHD